MTRSKLLWRSIGFWLALPFLTASLFGQGTPIAESSLSELLHRGFDFHQRADYASALPLLRQAWKLDPHDYFVNLLLGIDLLRTRKPEEAIGFLKEASLQRPKEDFPYAYSGEAQAMLGHYAEAAESYLRALQVNSESTEAMEGWVDYSLERFRQLAGQLRSSDRGLAAEYRLQARSYPAGDAKRRELLEHSAALDAKAPGIWSELALANVASGSEDEARKNADQATEQDAFDLKAMEAHALLSAHAEDWKHAAALLNEIAERSPTTLARATSEWPAELQPVAGSGVSGAAAKFLACARDRAQTCAAEGLVAATRSVIQSERATPARLFEEHRWDRLAAMREPSRGDAEAWFRRGVAFAQLGRCERAIPALERSLPNPNQPDRAMPEYAGFLLSWCYADEAGQVDRKARQMGGNEAISEMIRGDVLLRMQGDNAGAIASYQAALALRRNDPKLLERLAEAQVSAGIFDEAADNARLALRLDAHRRSARQTLARVAMEQGKYEEAVPLLKELAAENPKDESTQISLATALAQTGNPQEALLHLEPVLQSGYPDEKGSLHTLLGTLLRRVGRSTEAAQAFAKARALSDDYQRSPHRGPERP